MPGITRAQDQTSGICNIGSKCCPHGRTGNNAQVSPNVFINGKGAHRLNDTGPTNCPHDGTFQSVSASSSVFINGRPVTRIGDSTTCMVCGKSGTHVEGSGNVFAGG